MNSPTTTNADESYRMIAVKIYKDHRVDDLKTVYRIDPMFYQDLMVMLDELSKRTKDTSQDEDGDPEIMCDAGYEGCDHDDYESMSDDCRQARAEELNEARMDTYD